MTIGVRIVHRRLAGSWTSRCCPSSAAGGPAPGCCGNCSPRVARAAAPCRFTSSAGTPRAGCTSGWDCAPWASTGSTCYGMLIRRQVRELGAAACPTAMLGRERSARATGVDATAPGYLRRASWVPLAGGMVAVARVTLRLAEVADLPHLAGRDDASQLELTGAADVVPSGIHPFRHPPLAASSCSSHRWTPWWEPCSATRSWSPLPWASAGPTGRALAVGGRRGLGGVYARQRRPDKTCRSRPGPPGRGRARTSPGLHAAEGGRSVARAHRSAENERKRDASQSVAAQPLAFRQHELVRPRLLILECETLSHPAGERVDRVALEHLFGLTTGSKGWFRSAVPVVPRVPVPAMLAVTVPSVPGVSVPAVPGASRGTLRAPSALLPPPLPCRTSSRRPWRCPSARPHPPGPTGPAAPFHHLVRPLSEPLEVNHDPNLLLVGRWCR